MSQRLALAHSVRAEGGERRAAERRASMTMYGRPRKSKTSTGESRVALINPRRILNSSAPLLLIYSKLGAGSRDPWRQTSMAIVHPAQHQDYAQLMQNHSPSFKEITLEQAASQSGSSETEEDEGVFSVGEPPVTHGVALIG
jgi:hypothetical protein